MTIELLKRMMDACYQAKRIRDMLPPLPEGVTSSYIQYLDIIETMQNQGLQVKVSDISDSVPASAWCYQNSKGNGAEGISEKKYLSERWTGYLSDPYRNRTGTFPEV